jgi:seryl-tRNA synthetase
MLDPRWVAEDPDAVKANLTRRGADDSSFQIVDRLVALQERRTELVRRRDSLREERNQRSKAIGQLYREGKRDEAEASKAEVTKVNATIGVLEDELRNIEGDRRDLALHLPNVLADDVPPGKSEDDNVEVLTWGEPRSFDFEPQPHVEVGERLGILDLERSAKIAGSRFSVLFGHGARLERALINFFLDVHTGEHGYTETLVPYMVHANVAEGTGQLPKFADDMFKLEGTLNGSDTYLIPTAEVPVTNLHREEILDEDELPKRFVAFTPCFRSEAGSAGRDVRGLMRVHQFHKVELVHVVKPEDSAEAHEALTSHAETCLQRLGLPYRKVLLCAGDTSFGAARCYDLEVWLPSQGTFREVSSCSNFHDFQARRMDLRYRPASEGKKKAKPRFAHTLNGSGLAVGRTLLAILENYQEADGSVVVPEVLRPYMGTDRLVPPTS